MTLTVERLSLRGEGITADGVTVPLALPGEEVTGEIVEGRITAPRIVTPVPDRVRAPCPHFARCGGCALQHASDDFVADWKVQVVARALAGQGLEAPMRPILTSPPASRRRAVLAGRRTKKGALVGFHARASDVIVPIPDCRLLHPDLMAALPACEEVTVLGGSRKGELGLTLTRSVDGVDLTVTQAKPADGPMLADLAVLAARHDLARLTWNGDTLATRRPPRQTMGRAHVVPPPGAFLQATEAGQAALTDAVRAALGDVPRVADLFAGCGTFALPLAETAQVHAVEGSAAMLAALDAGWRQAQGLKRVTTEARDLFRRPLMPDELKTFDAVVIDPPRAGAEAQVAQIAASSLPVVAMVSCNPVSFARDARVLTQAGFRLDWVQVVDQFRWSGHVELAARLSRGHIA
ncbi:class I SAM-dependent RNA methyltransferase [Rhodovulum adriaticum]|uniref:23S rRNA m(5)U-1939 methyltransferase n=1 Tax=Rhodovulum adriaticum TaxID=35804 RepID=A0A4R2NZ95_RHOAD|nr:class I SAM-dependent RNA methyltransferase [Rhodovulum adriaticum]MBK1636129.1 RNA methyltransferase [Rhodovulum adriaticum]TCP27512.1 23S rRNA m(5)U-1939 methyltransferase [Rhodovulum adriaticum]